MGTGVLLDKLLRDAKEQHFIIFQLDNVSSKAFHFGMSTAFLTHPAPK